MLTPRLLTPSSGDRIPAIVSAVSTVVALVGVAFTFLFQVQDAVSEAVTGIPTVGVDFGGIGGGVWGVDAGLFQVFDVAQFVVMSGQLSGTATPWVVKYFIEYFTPFTGLVPVKGEASFPYDVDAGVWSGAAPPRAITGLLQGGYWTSLTPQALFSYSYFVTALWAAAVAIVAFVVATVWASQFSSARGLSRRRRGVGLGAGASPGDAVNLRATAPVSDQRPSVVTAALWMVGRLAALYSGVYYVLAVTTVFQLWHVAFVHGREAVVAWVLGIAVLLLPVAGLLYLSCRRNVVVSAGTVNSATQLALGPLLASFRSGCAWFGVAILADRLLFAAIVVTASPRPVLQLVLVVARSLLWLALIAVSKPYRHLGVQRLSVALALFRPIILCLSVMFIPSAASDDGAWGIVCGRYARGPCRPRS